MWNVVNASVSFPDIVNTSFTDIKELQETCMYSSFVILYRIIIIYLYKCNHKSGIQTYVIREY